MHRDASYFNQCALPLRHQPEPRLRMHPCIRTNILGMDLYMHPYEDASTDASIRRCIRRCIHTKMHLQMYPYKNASRCIHGRTYQRCISLIREQNTCACEQIATSAMNSRRSSGSDSRFLVLSGPFQTCSHLQHEVHCVSYAAHNAYGPQGRTGGRAIGRTTTGAT